MLQLQHQQKHCRGEKPSAVKRVDRTEKIKSGKEVLSLTGSQTYSQTQTDRWQTNKKVETEAGGQADGRQAEERELEREREREREDVESNRPTDMKCRQATKARRALSNANRTPTKFEKQKKPRRALEIEGERAQAKPKVPNRRRGPERQTRHGQHTSHETTGNK